MMLKEVVHHMPGRCLQALTKDAVMVWMRNISHRLLYMNPCPQMAILFKEAMEHLGHGVLLKEVHLWEHIFRIYSFLALAVCSLFASHEQMKMWSGVSCPCCYSFLALKDI